jgi:hypothetical protein
MQHRFGSQRRYIIFPSKVNSSCIQQVAIAFPLTVSLSARSQQYSSKQRKHDPNFCTMYRLGSPYSHVFPIFSPLPPLRKPGVRKLSGQLIYIDVLMMEDSMNEHFQEKRA